VALIWLKGVEGMNGITDDVIYRASNPDERDIDGNLTNGKPMLEVLKNLGRKIQRRYEDGMTSDSYPKVGDVSDPAATVGSDYEIFDQWTEVLPTDQIVPVEVRYDRKTGRQL
jgi:hypothetical protein